MVWNLFGFCGGDVKEWKVMCQHPLNQTGTYTNPCSSGCTQEQLKSQVRLGDDTHCEVTERILSFDIVKKNGLWV